jgi:hypothetical protein
MISQLNIYDENGIQLNLDAMGIQGLKLLIPSPSYSTITQQVEGRGTIVVDKQLNPRSLVADFMTFADSYEDLLEQKTLLNSIIGNGREFYIEQVHRNGHLWKCHLDEWTPEVIGTKNTVFSITMTCMSGVSESITPIEATFTTSSFTFFNSGNQVVDPRLHSEMKIEFSGASTNLTITNETTGDVWSYTGSTLSTDTILLKGIRSFKNGVSVFGATNRKLITLAIEDNDFTVSGASGEFDLTISTRFYFL